MRNLHIFLVIVLFFACDNHMGQNNTNADLYKNFSSQQFLYSIEKEPGIILDVRTIEEVALGIIEGASHIDFYDADFARKISKIQKDKVIYVYCRSGGRSSRAAKLLIKQGFKNIINLKGGILSWKKSGFALTNMDYNNYKNVEEINIDYFNHILSANKFVLANFHTRWCVPCRKMSPVIDELEKQYSNQILISKIDIDNSSSLSNTYKIDAVPTLILYKESKEIWRHTGIISKEDLEVLLQNSL